MKLPILSFLILRVLCVTLVVAFDPRCSHGRPGVVSGGGDSSDISYCICDEGYSGQSEMPGQVVCGVSENSTIQCVLSYGIPCNNDIAWEKGDSWGSFADECLPYPLGACKEV
jgi:hypothetical protein